MSARKITDARVRAAIYARSAVESPGAIVEQVRICRDYAARDDMTILNEHIYSDEAESGMSRTRPGLNTLLEAAKGKAFDAIIIAESSRLARDNVYFNALITTFTVLGVRLISVSDGLDTGSDHAKLACQLHTIFNELHVDDMRNRTRRGQIAQVTRGYSPGWRGYGYTTVPACPIRRGHADHKLIIDRGEASVVVGIFKGFIKGMSPTAIAATLNAKHIPTRQRQVWTASAVRQILRSERFLGRFYWSRTARLRDPASGKVKVVKRPEGEWVTFEDRSLQIISENDWAAAKKRLTSIQSARWRWGRGS